MNYIEKYQQGGVVDTTGYQKLSNNLLHKYKDLNFIQRLDQSNPDSKLRYVPKHGEFGNNSSYGSHYMTYVVDNKGNNWMYPQIVQKKGDNKLTFISNFRDADRYAQETGEQINLGKDGNFAEYMSSVGYKKPLDKDTYNAAKSWYIKRTNIAPANKVSRNQASNDSPSALTFKATNMFGKGGKVTNTEKDKKDVNLLSRYQQPSDATNENNK